MKIGIIDYGAGNTANVKNAFSKLEIDATVSDSRALWENADAIVLPGVGSFGSAMEKLGDSKESIIAIIKSGKPFLGICLGMQLLLDSSQESQEVKGFGIIKGKVNRFNSTLPVPQTGWNYVKPVSSLYSILFDGLGDFYAYFNHSYYCKPNEKNWISATANYGIEFPCALAKSNIYATQFHPEKSGKVGLQILQNFIHLVRK